jgi:hypothetical protein
MPALLEGSCEKVGVGLEEYESEEDREIEKRRGGSQR